VSSVEHGYEIDQEGIDVMLKKGTYLVPTLSAALRMPDPAKVPPYLYWKKVVWSAIAREHLANALQSRSRDRKVVTNRKVVTRYASLSLIV